jgi:hypothetical protein
MMANSVAAAHDNASAGSPVRLRAHCELLLAFLALMLAAPVCDLVFPEAILTRHGISLTALSPGRKRRLLGQSRPASLDVSDVSCVARRATCTLISTGVPVSNHPCDAP